MLTVIMLKNIPTILTLEFNTQHADSSSSVDIFDLLKFIQNEISVYERSFFNQNPTAKEPDPS